MNPLDLYAYTPEEFDRHLAERRASMRQAQALAGYVYSRSGLLARFLQRMADRIDPTGEARGGWFVEVR